MLEKKEKMVSLWDLQRANQISQNFSSSLNLEEIANLATEGLVRHFDCTFARIWLVEPDHKMLHLVASSGLYTRTDGSFSRIPMGAFKIGRIAQNRVSLLSNNLAEESWVRHPEWAIANDITSFVGYPLANSDKVVGVLAVFGRNPLKSDFLNLLLSLCTTLTVALEMAALHHQEKQGLQTVSPQITITELSLSDSLAHILGQVTLTVLGTERSLDLSQTQIFLKVAETLKKLDCSYCRLTYKSDSVSLEGFASLSLLEIPQEPSPQETCIPKDIVATSPISTQEIKEWERAIFGHLFPIASCFGGILKINTEASPNIVQVSLTFPLTLPELSLRIRCRLPLLQIGFTQLAYTAGLRVCARGDRHVPLLTDCTSGIETSDHIIWISHNSTIIPGGVQAQINLSTTSKQLREAVETVMRGETWAMNNHIPRQQKLSPREREIITLLVQGLRDRDIAQQLYISDSTVKFHINNILAKLEAKTRLQALYKLMNSNGLEI